LFKLALRRFAKSLRPLPSLRPRPVIARNEAIYRRSHNSLDCHGAARLAMTKGVVIAPHPVDAPPTRHCEERSNPSAAAQQPGLPRRCAPRNDERGCHCPSPRRCAPAPSLRGTKQSIGRSTTARIATALRASQCRPGTTPQAQHIGLNRPSSEARALDPSACVPVRRR
jgi:hypothetical protein